MKGNQGCDYDAAGHDWWCYVVDYMQYRMYEPVLKSVYNFTNWWLPAGPWSPVLRSTVYTYPLVRLVWRRPLLRQS